MLVLGEWVEASDGAAIRVLNPATEEAFAEVPRASDADVDRAVGAAEAAFPAWAALSPFERGEVLRRAADLALQRAERIGRAMTEEQGKPLSEATGEARKGAAILRYYAEEGERVCGRIAPNPRADMESRVACEPVGPCAAISPWNYPVELVAWKVAGALAAGCTVVCKPPSLAPISPLLFIGCLVDAGAPAGVVNAVTGSGEAVGRRLIEDPRIRKVAFTGSTEVGRDVAERCGRLLKRVSLELGGQCPLIVSRRCELAAAAAGALRRSFRNMGQICIAVNRIYVQRKVHDEFVARLVEGTRRLVIGNGLDRPDCDLGPMTAPEGVQKAERHVADALERGAELACGGRRPEGEEFRRGYFYEPTVLTGCTHEMLVMREETFGPVVGVTAFDALDEAIALANDTPYGLAAYAYTDDLGEARRLSAALQAGNVAINNPDAGVLNAPYGGWKESGLGCEHGPEGLHEYLRTKHVRVRYPRAT